ncbi:MAG: GNAT family N-acetyltransferase [Paludibacteraceae bacterium]
MITTKRLGILPLSYEQLMKYTRCDSSLDTELNLQQTYRIISEELREALEYTILPNVADKNKNYLFSTIWIAFSYSENKPVGDFCWYGEPNEKGEIEIGYGIYQEFEGQGYMTEIVKGAIEWAKTYKYIKAIKATTTKINIPSFKVLERNGFLITEETEELFYWRLKL